jgi:hypothetical protein
MGQLSKRPPVMSRAARMGTMGALSLSEVQPRKSGGGFKYSRPGMSHECAFLMGTDWKVCSLCGYSVKL